MENGITFRFEANNLKKLLSGAVPAEFVHVSFFLVLTDDRANVIMKSQAEAFSADATSIGVDSGCPVPPCALTDDHRDDPDCGNQMQEILQANSKK